MKFARFTLAASLLATPALAQEAPTKPFTITGSFTLASDYRLRGVSQSDKHIAVQGGVTIAHQTGFYVAAWGSNLAGWGTFGGSNTELDLIGGYKHTFSGVTLDAGLTWYMYPGGASKTDYGEPYIKASTTLGPVNALIGVAYAPKQQALGNWSFTGANAQAVLAGAAYNDAFDKEDNVYVWVDGNVGIPGLPLTAKAHLGYSDGNPGLGPNGTSVAPTGKYLDWMLGADYVIGPLTIGVAYIDTDISKRESLYLQPNFSSTKNGSSIAGSTVVGSLTASF